MANEKCPGSGERPPFEIRERTFQFAARSVRLVKQFPLTVGATEVARQVVGAAASSVAMWTCVSTGRLACMASGNGGIAIMP